MMSSVPGFQRIFLDNFYGNGARHPDMSYPRMQAGDDPYPNATLVHTPPPYNPNVYAGGMKLQGCFANQDPPALTNLTYSGNNNTLKECTNRCHSGGNLIAALMNSSLCYCGSKLSYETVQVVNNSCNFDCSGAPQKKCGGSNRLSVFSKAKPVIAARPGKKARNTVRGLFTVPDALEDLRIV